MKFTKEEAVEKLKLLLTNNGKKTLRMSTRTLEGHTESLMALVADDETELDDFVEKVKGNLEAVNSNMEHDYSDFVKNYKPTPKQEPPKKDDDDDKGNDPNKALLDRIAALEKMNADREAETKRKEKRSQIRKYLSDNNVDNNDWVDRMLKVTSIADEDDVEEKGKELLDIYNASLAGAGGSDFTPRNPKPGDNDQTGQYDDVKAIIKRRNGVTE